MVRNDLLLIVGALAGVLLGTAPVLSQDGVWAMKQPLPAPRNEVGRASCRERVYGLV